MKTRTLIVLLGLCLTGPFAVKADTENAAKLDAAAIETLVGPVALYPDALIAIILPASANATDLVLAARFLENVGTLGAVDEQPWDQSVRALARYPEVLKWMDENLAWTQQLGVTFLLQPEEVMAAIQRLRSRAHALGNLPSTEQLTVINQDNYIRIVPTYSETIYVPYYDPEIIYVSRFYWGFGPAWMCGPWLTFDCNWVRRNIWIGTWAPAHFHRPEWRIIGRRPTPPQFVERHTWRPDHRRIGPRPPQPPPRPGVIIRPRPIGDSKQWHGRDYVPPGERSRRPPPPANAENQRPPSGKGSGKANMRERTPNQPPPPANPNPTSSQRMRKGVPPPRTDNVQQPSSPPPVQNRSDYVRGQGRRPPEQQRQTRDGVPPEQRRPANNPPSGNASATDNNQRATMRQRPAQPPSNPNPPANQPAPPPQRSSRSSDADNNSSTGYGSGGSSGNSSNSNYSNGGSRSFSQPPSDVSRPPPSAPPSRDNSSRPSGGMRQRAN